MIKLTSTKAMVGYAIATIVLIIIPGGVFIAPITGLMFMFCLITRLTGLLTSSIKWSVDLNKGVWKNNAAQWRWVFAKLGVKAK